MKINQAMDLDLNIIMNLMTIHFKDILLFDVPSITFSFHSYLNIISSMFLHTVICMFVKLLGSVPGALVILIQHKIVYPK